MSRLCVWLCAALVVACVAAGCCPSATAQSAASVISAVRGCAATVGNSTRGCNYNDTVFIYGTNLPTGSSISVLLTNSFTSFATNVTSYNSSALSARLPYIATRDETTYGVQVLNGTAASNVAALVTYTSQAPVVWRVTGCPANNYTDNSTSGCMPGMVVTIDGHHFAPLTVSPYRLYVTIGWQTSTTCTYVSTTRILCTLPPAPINGYIAWQWVEVTTGGLISNSPYLVRYASPSSSSSSAGRFATSTSTGGFIAPSPVISSIAGCALQFGNGTSSCSFNDTIFIYGTNLPTGSGVTVLLSNAYYATSVTSYSSTMLSARLPYIQTTTTSTYSVQVRNLTVSSNAVPLVTYTSQVPVVWRVSGCPVTNYTGNSTSGCAPGMVVTIDGHHFLPPPSYYLSVYIARVTTSACTYISTSRIQCVLPLPTTPSFFNAWAPVEVQAGSYYSNSPYLVMYTPSSSISRIVGCALLSGSGTSGCSFNDTIFIFGDNLPTGSNISVLLSGAYYATNIVSYNSSALSARLPYIPTSSGGICGVQVLNTTVFSNVVPLVTYMSQVPVVYRVTGCPVSNAVVNGTSDCMPGMVVTIDGHHFLPPPTYAFVVAIVGYPSACTFIGTSRIQCVLPVIASAYYNNWVSIRVQAGSLYSNYVYLVRYASPSSSSTGRYVSSSSTGGIVASPSISAVRGCAVQSGSATSGCNFNDTIFIYGTNLPTGSGITVLLSSSSTYYATNIVSYNSSALSARLPYIAISYATAYSVQVLNSAVSSNAATLVTYMSQVPVIYRVTGCPVNDYTGNTTSGCTPGMVVTIDGHHFLPPPSYAFSVIVGGAYTSACTYVSTTRITCVLPAVAGSNYNTWLAVQVQAGSYYSNSPYLVMYTPSSSISRIVGCALQLGNGTSGCSFNDTIFIFGDNLPTGTGISVSLSSPYNPYYASSVTSYSSTVLSARLPYIPTNSGGIYGVQVRNNTVSSNNVSYVTYASQTPVVWRVSGCPVNNYVGNSTSGCMPGMVVTIDGHHFVPADVPPYSLYVYIGGQYSSMCTFINTMRITCTLPSVPSNGYYVWQWIQVSTGQLNSNSPYLVMYGSPFSSSSTGGQNAVFISSVSGCSTPGQCVAGDQVMLSGSGFTNTMALRVYAQSAYYPCTKVIYWSSSTMYCTLPAIPVLASLLVQLQVWTDGGLGSSIGMYFYPTPSSTGGGGSGSSKSGLTIDDLIVIVLVVVLVVGLLLVCQVLYCLHHFAGVKFPRLARLTGGRLFAVAEVPAVEGAEIDLSLLAHDHHQQQPMLREMHPQPQSAQPPPVAAASYHSPAYYMPAPPAQPAPIPQYQAAHAPAPGPAPFLYPRSFVPSPQYYQAAS